MAKERASQLGLAGAHSLAHHQRARCSGTGRGDRRLPRRRDIAIRGPLRRNHRDERFEQEVGLCYSWRQPGCGARSATTTCKVGSHRRVTVPTILRRGDNNIYTNLMASTIWPQRQRPRATSSTSHQLGVDEVRWPLAGRGETMYIPTTIAECPPPGEGFTATSLDFARHPADRYPLLLHSTTSTSIAAGGQAG